MFKSRGFASHVAPLLVALLIVIADRFTKLRIQQAFSSFDSVMIVPGWLRIIHTENPGAAFGMLADGNPVLRSVILIGVSALVLFFVGAALLGQAPAFTALLTRFGLGLILGGALGNLYDRAMHGTVTDFIEVYHGGWAFPAFNVADSAITIGAVLLLLELVIPNRKHLQENPELAPK